MIVPYKSPIITRFDRDQGTKREVATTVLRIAHLQTEMLQRTIWFLFMTWIEATIALSQRILETL